MRSRHDNFHNNYFKTPKLAIKIFKSSIKELKGGYNSSTGICDNIDKLYTSKIHKLEEIPAFRKYVYDKHIDIQLGDALSRLLKSWPEGTGCDVYPVPSPYEDISARSMFHKSWGEGNMWIGKYGINRKKLLEYLIANYDKLEEFM